MDARMQRIQSEKVSKELRKIMRLRFQRLVRSVMINLEWLEDPEDQGIVMNAKRNVALLIRQRRKTGILTVAERALLRTSHENRSVEDRKKLCMIVASLPCFAFLPPKLRVRLVPYLRIGTIGYDRKLIRQNDEPIMVYFVISGEIEIMKSVYDQKTKKITVKSDAILSGGDVIGDVELLEKCFRLNSYTTRSPCELLHIMDTDFHNVIGKFMSNVWMQKKMALRSLSYFDFFTEDQLVRACSYCQLVKYDPLDSIYSEDKGAVACVHFVLSGECLILQCLEVQASANKDGTKVYKLTKVSDTEPANANLPTAPRPRPQDKAAIFDGLVASSSDSSGSRRVRIKTHHGPKVSLRDIELACGAGKIPDRLLPRRKKSHSVSKRRQGDLSHNPSLRHLQDDEVFEEENEYSYYYEEEGCEDISVDDTSRRQSHVSVRRSKLSRLSSIRRSITGLHKRSTNTIDYSSNESSITSTDSYDWPISIPRFETRFMDVGSLTTGAVFGLGEKTVHRVIMARTVVQCLLLPRYWLMNEDQNPGRIWLRLRFYLENSIPSREEVFKISLQTRKWEKLRSDYVQSTLNPDSSNATHPEDIPIFSRILETRDEI